MLPNPKKTKLSNKMSINSDATKEVKWLFGIYSETITITTALDEFKEKNYKVIPNKYANNLNVFIKAYGYIHNTGRQQTSRVSVVSHVLESYQMVKVVGRKNEKPCPKNTRVSDAMWRRKKL